MCHSQTWNNYGIDDDAPLPNVDSDNDVQIPCTRSYYAKIIPVQPRPQGLLGPGDEVDSNAFRNTVVQLLDDMNEGIHVYTNSINLIRQYQEVACCNM